MIDAVGHLILAFLATVCCLYMVGTEQWCLAFCFAFWSIFLASRAVTLLRLELMVSSLRRRLEDEIARQDGEQD